MAKTEFERSVEKNVGLSVEVIRAMSLEQMRARNEKKFGRGMTVSGVGPGGIRVLSHEEVEK